MQNSKYRVTMSDIHRNIVNKLVDPYRKLGSEIAFTYQSLNIFKSNRHDAAAVIGMMALSDVARTGNPMSVIAQKLPELVNAGILHLAMKPDAWRFVGCGKSMVELQAAVTNGSDHARRREIEALLGISERRSSRYLFLNRYLVLTTGNDHPNSSLMETQGFSIAFDAVGYANELKARCPGAFFTVETEEQS